MNLILDAPAERGMVVMLCGMAGAGKTTLAQRLENQAYTRLSIDEEIWRRFGKFGVDYAASDYPVLQDTVRDAQRAQLIDLLERNLPVVLDSSFWQKAQREDYKALIESHGCRWHLLYLKVDEQPLRRRLRERSKRFDANAAFPISDAIFERYWSGFEFPDNEGEQVIEAMVG